MLLIEFAALVRSLVRVATADTDLCWKDGYRVLLSLSHGTWRADVYPNARKASAVLVGDPSHAPNLLVHAGTLCLLPAELESDDLFNVESVMFDTKDKEIAIQIVTTCFTADYSQNSVDAEVVLHLNPAKDDRGDYTGCCFFVETGLDFFFDLATADEAMTTELAPEATDAAQEYVTEQPLDEMIDLLRQLDGTDYLEPAQVDLAARYYEVLDKLGLPPAHSLGSSSDFYSSETASSFLFRQAADATSESETRSDAGLPGFAADVAVPSQDDTQLHIEVGEGQVVSVGGVDFDRSLD